MTTFLTRILDRHTGISDTVRPRPLAMFEPEQPYTDLPRMPGIRSEEAAPPPQSNVPPRRQEVQEKREKDLRLKAQPDKGLRQEPAPEKELLQAQDPPPRLRPTQTRRDPDPLPMLTEQPLTSGEKVQEFPTEEPAHARLLANHPQETAGSEKTVLKLLLKERQAQPGDNGFQHPEFPGQPPLPVYTRKASPPAQGKGHYSGINLPEPAEAAPVTIHIGRIELRSAPRTASEKQPRTKAEKKPALTLEEFLKKRKEK